MRDEEGEGRGVREGRGSEGVIPYITTDQQHKAVLPDCIRSQASGWYPLMVISSY